MTVKNIFQLPEQTAKDCKTIAEKIEIEKLMLAFFNENKKRYYFENITAPIGSMGCFVRGFYPSQTFFAPCKRMFNDLKISPELGFLAVFTEFIQKTLDIYVQHGVPEDIAQSLCSFISHEVQHFYLKKGYYGIYDYVWMSCFLIPELFQIGSFQFRLLKCPYNHLQYRSIPINKGCPIIQIHVPGHSDISENSVESAFHIAKELFGTPIFLMDSWLLFPEHKIMLPDDSAIVSLANRFEIIKTSKTMDREALVRVFGQDAYKDPVYWEKKTTLQKAYYERYISGKSFGSAIGVYVLD